MKKKEIIISIIVKIIAVVLMTTGVMLSVTGGDELMPGVKSLMFFTLQSNILAIIISAIGLVFDFIRLSGKKVLPHKIFYFFKLVATTGVTLTFLVFWTLLTPMVSEEYLYSISNLSLHTFGPLLVLFDYIFFTPNFKPKRRELMIPWAFPLLYLAFAMIMSASNITFGGSMHVPYFFLDYKVLGWFTISKSGIGVFYWVLIVLILVYGIAFGIHALHQLYKNRIRLIKYINNKK